MIAAIGSGDQRMFIVPSMNLVIVRQGRDTAAFPTPISPADFCGRRMTEFRSQESGAQELQELQIEESTALARVPPES